MELSWLATLKPATSTEILDQQEQPIEQQVHPAGPVPDLSTLITTYKAQEVKEAW
jgi:hypothetical protein